MEQLQAKAQGDRQGKQEQDEMLGGSSGVRVDTLVPESLPRGNCTKKFPSAVQVVRSATASLSNPAEVR